MNQPGPRGCPSRAPEPMAAWVTAITAWGTPVLLVGTASSVQNALVSLICDGSIVMARAEITASPN